LLPILPWGSYEDLAERERFEMSEMSFDQFITVQGKSVLVVDDSPEMRMFLSRTLVMFGCKVRFAGNGAEAVEKASEKYFDVILMDLCMPVLDGLSATQMLRIAGYQGMILGLTAQPDLIEDAEPDDLGFDDCLIKPINRIQLLSRISALSASTEN
jgi:CheY-like chemotaxis protein